MLLNQQVQLYVIETSIETQQTNIDSFLFVFVFFLFTLVEPLPNVAINRETAQSSTIDLGQASNAVRGSRCGSFTDRCCAHTDLQDYPWWRVDLLAVHKVSAVAIINRQDCCSDRLIGAQIHIGNSQWNHGNRNPR